MGPTTPPCKHDGLGWSAFARRYWRNHCCFLFLWVLRWFTSPRCLPTAYGFSGGSFGINRRGFPHSDIPGSKLVCSSPGLIAAYHVLHRLLAPRHSPYALSSLTIRNSNLTLAGFPARGVGLRVHCHWPLAGMRQIHAHCVCVVDKTTVCRIFSCQRSFGAPPRTPARSLAGPQGPAPLPRSSLTFVRSRVQRSSHWQAVNFSKTVEPSGEPGLLGSPARQHRPATDAK
jgi:hypothetical protein